MVYLITCNKCCNGEGNYIGESCTKIRFRINNHKTSIRNDTQGHTIANNLNKNDHTANDIRCCILKENYKSTKEIQLYEQKLIVKYNCHINGLNKHKSFLSNYHTRSYI